MAPGRNEAHDWTWETRSVVVSAERSREFAFIVGGTWIRWGYVFASVEGGASVTESWELLPDGVAWLKERYGAAAEAQIADRFAAARHGIPATLAALKLSAESRSDQV